MGTETHPADEAINTRAHGVGHDEDANGRASQTGRAASSQQSTAQQNFEFVLVTDEGSRRQVRRHAMRQYMRQRRLEGIARLGSSRVAIAGWAPRETVDTPLDSPGFKVKAEEADDGHEEERINKKGRTRGNAPDTRRRNHTVSGGSSSGHQEDVPSNRPSALDRLPSPGPGGKRDPFDSYPISISQQDHKLINHCKFYCSQFLRRYVQQEPLLTPARCRDLSFHDVQTVGAESKEPDHGNLPEICPPRSAPVPGDAGHCLQASGQCGGPVGVGAKSGA